MLHRRRRRPGYLPGWWWKAERWTKLDAKLIGASMSAAHKNRRSTFVDPVQRSNLRWVVGIGTVIAAIIAAAMGGGYVTSSFVQVQASGSGAPAGAPAGKAVGDHR